MVPGVDQPVLKFLPIWLDRKDGEKLFQQIDPCERRTFGPIAAVTDRGRSISALFDLCVGSRSTTHDTTAKNMPPKSAEND